MPRDFLTDLALAQGCPEQNNESDMNVLRGKGWSGEYRQVAHPIEKGTRNCFGQ